MSWTRFTRNKIKFIGQDFILLLFLFTVLTMLTISTVLHSEQTAETDQAQETVINALINMESSPGYTFVINEETSDYELKFAGHMVNPDKVIGMFGQYDLKIYRISDDIFIKNPVSQEWELAKNLEMEDLGSFIQSPTGIMKEIANKWSDPKLIKREVLNDEGCLVYLYAPPPEERNDFLNAFYPHISPDWLNNLSFRLWIREDDPYLYKIEFLLSLEVPEYGSQEISREILVNSNEQEITGSNLIRRET